MSDKPEQPEQPEVTSVFSESEPPEEGANVFDESPPEEKQPDDGHLRKTISTDGQDLYDHSDEIEAERQQEEADGVAPPPMPEREPMGIRNPMVHADPAEAIREEIENRFAEEFRAEKVTVTNAERDAFVRAALHDSELVFEVEIEALDAVVSVAIPSDTFTSCASAAAYKWGEEGHIDKTSDLQWVLTFQQMHAWFQVRAIDGTPTAWADEWDTEKPHSAKHLRELLENPENIEPIQRLNGVRWRLFLNAIRIAEQKYKICLSNWQDRTFFTGADTD